MTRSPHHRGRRFFLRLAAVVALVALGLMTWPIFDPAPLALIAAMSLAQGLGTLSLGIYLVVVALDLVRARVFPKRVASDAPRAGTPEA